MMLLCQVEVQHVELCVLNQEGSVLSVAERVADERAERIGEGSVGYQIRLER